MNDQQLIPELYRKEYSKMVTVLCSRFGIAYMDDSLHELERSRLFSRAEMGYDFYNGL